MKTTKQLAKLGCVLLVTVFACVMLTGCGHRLSGTYRYQDFTISFNSKESCRMYYDSTDNFIEGTYYWDNDLNCYFLEFNETGQGNVRFRAEEDKDNLYVTIQGEKLLFTKK